MYKVKTLITDGTPKTQYVQTLADGREKFAIEKSAIVAANAEFSDFAGSVVLYDTDGTTALASFSL